MEKCLIVKDSIKTVRQYGVQGRILEFKIRPIPEKANPVKWVKDAIEEVVVSGTENLNPTDLVGFSFCSKDFARGEGWIRFKPLKEVTMEDVWNTISSIYQSNSTGLNTETFCLRITSVKLPAGRGKGKNYNSFYEECSRRRGIVVIKNTDKMCLPRALVVAKAFKDKDFLYNQVRNNVGKIQDERASALVKDVNIVIPEEGAGIPELVAFQHYLSNYKIVVYQYGTKGRNIIFEGKCNGYPSLNLLYHEGHYNVITSLTAAFCCTYYCEECHVPYNDKKKHKCGGTCFGCQQSPACSKMEPKMKCGECKRFFYGKVCYVNHIEHRICNVIRLCEECFKVVRVNRQHICGEVYCRICQKYQPSGHLCYIQPDTRTPHCDDLLFVFYDLETRQEKKLEDGSSLHEPNLCVLNQRCHRCMNESLLYFCQSCGFRQRVLVGNVINKLMEHVLTLRKKFKKVVVLAHNGGGYDHQFILNYILINTDLQPELIMRGTKVIIMELGNVKFLDSLNYFPMALSKLPKAFGLTELKKGYFPHLFNITENQNYVGKIPSIEYYDPDNLKEDNREDLVKWYTEKENEGYIFDFQKEIKEYCISDVDILTQACLKFRELLLREGYVCPFTEASTIASACNKVFRRNFLNPNTIGIIPKNGYRWKDNQSRIATQWLVWEENQRNCNIIHAAKQSEVTVAGLKVDGICYDNNTIFEFHGCYYHGCPDCFKHQRDVPLQENPSENLIFRYENTQAKTIRLKKLGYQVIEMWECTFRRQLKNKEIEAFTNTHPLLSLSPLNPRDAFYGGRTGNVVEYYKINDNEKIKYVDVCSLYPWVCKYGKFPVGHPRVLVGSECSTDHLTSGLVKCKILPPQDLFHPLLPQKMNGKLMFVLCNTCGLSSSTETCHHTADERALIGTWVIEEVLKALEVGYTFLDIYEIWQYDTIQFNENVPGLFTEMMNKFIKIKQESSDWPKNCKNPEEREHYIKEYFQRENVHLDIDKIEDNPGLRSLAKLMLNSFWGKFGQRENQSKTVIINKPSEFFNTMTNPSLIINSILPINENTIIVTYEKRDETYSELSTVNVSIAAYVTSQARIKLYSYLEKLGERVLYYDTDSVIYISRPEEFDVPTGSFLGELTDELETFGPGSFISEFVSGGPKNYAYRVYSPTKKEEYIICKVKGLSLNFMVSKLVNFETIKKMVLEKTESIYVSSIQIKRTEEHEVVSQYCSKIYRPHSTKRMFQSDHSSTPFGYKKIKM